RREFHNADTHLDSPDLFIIVIAFLDLP
ncbi:MAG: hypothetical protein QOH33_649, partial [Paraburkholderia sp.]|nr:hypothetical protein [Paraburkholderia sp.]